MPATLTSRIPQIILSMPEKVQDAVQEGLGRIADDAASRAPRHTGQLAESIEAREDGIYAEWYWFFPEFGTTRAGAQPYMMPAVEAQRDSLIDDIEEALEDL